MNYYQQLEISSDASQQEIEDVIDEKYDEWRRLVNHHDQRVVQKANATLTELQEIRAVLTDPEKRRAYDAQLGVVGGITDPEAFLKQIGAAPTPPPPDTRPTEQTPSALQDWQCPNCNTVNEKGLQFCSKCGTRIGEPCPSCENMVYVGNSHCGKCGVNVAETKKQNFEQLRQRLLQLEQNRLYYMGRLITYDQAIAELENVQKPLLVLNPPQTSVPINSDTAIAMALFIVIYGVPAMGLVLLLFFGTSIISTLTIMSIVSVIIVVIGNQLGRLEYENEVSAKLNTLRQEKREIERDIRAVQALNTDDYEKLVALWGGQDHTKLILDEIHWSLSGSLLSNEPLNFKLAWNREENIYNIVNILKRYILQKKGDTVR